ADPATKVYDGTDVFSGLTATVTGIPDASLSGNVFNQDTVAVTLNPSMGSKNVGSYLIGLQSVVQPSGYGSYSYVPGGTAQSTPATLTINATAESKIYDSTTAGFATPTLSGLVGTDSVSGLAQSFDSKNVGARTLSVGSGYLINDSNGGNNYVVSLGSASG